MSDNIKPKLYYHNNTNVVKVLARYHRKWQCLCLCYVNTDNDLAIVILNQQTVRPVQVCSRDYILSETQPKQASQALTSPQLEHFKFRLSLIHTPVRFVHNIAKLLED